MKCSIVIRSYNEEKHIGRLLYGLQQQTLPPHEVIVVDSGSTDRTVAIAREYGASILSIRKEDFSFGRALNIGCDAATGDILVFVSAHVYPVHKVWLEHLVAPFADPRVVLAYGKQRGNSTNKFSEHQIFRKWFPDTSVCPQKTYFCNNANCAVRKEEWEQHPYDETLSGLEDLAWAKAAQERGGQIAYVAEAPVIHVHDEKWSQVRNRYQREAMALKKINGQISFGFGSFLRLAASNILSDYRAAVQQGVLLREMTSIPLFRINQFWGTYKGFAMPECEVSAELRDRFYFPPPSPAQEEDDAPELRAKKIDYDILA